MRADATSRLAALERDLAEVSPAELPRLLGELACLQAIAKRLGVSQDFLYRAKELPFRSILG